GIVALLGQPLARFLADLKRDRVLDQALAYLVELQIDNLLDFRAAERTEDDGRIDAVDKLGAEGTAQLLHDVLPHFLVVALLVGFRLRCWNAEAERAAAFDGIRADVARHDDDRVAEVHAATARIRQLALFHDLKQHVKGFRVGLFDFVEDDNAVRTATNGLGQLTGVLITDIAGRRTDQTSDRVPLHELAHVKLDERVFAAKQEFGQRLGQLGLTNTGRPQEHERTDRTARVLQAGAGAANRLADRFDGFVLAHDTLVQRIFHVDQAGTFLASNPHNRNARPHRHHFGDVIGAQARLVGVFVPVSLERAKRRLQAFALRAQRSQFPFRR